MNINLHNYESFFLMYVDDELSATERLSVQHFILQYPHLNEELQLLQDLVLPVDERIGFDKNALYRNTQEENIQAAMLLLIDDELPLGESNKLLQNMASNEKMQESFSQLKKAKLDPLEVLYFPHKKMLYRRKDSKIFYARFAKWSVAAALVAAAFLAGISVVTKQQSQKLASSGNPDAKNIGAGLGRKEDEINDASIIGKGNVLPSQAVSLRGIASINRSNPSPISRKKNKQAPFRKSDWARKNTNTIASNTITVFPLKNETTVSGKPIESLPILANNGNLNQTRVNAWESNVETTTMALVPRDTKRESKTDITDVELNPKQNQYAKTSSYQSEEPLNDNRVFLIREQDLAHSKAGIIFKRVKRTVSRNINMNSGNGLKIAGFEFAAQ